MTIEFDSKQINNLINFLGRADLKGTEAPAFCELMNTIVNQVNKPN